MMCRRMNTRGTDVSLRIFHLVFIALSVVLAVFVAAWAVGQYRSDAGTGYVIAAVLCILSAAGLAVYGTRFQRKTRQLV